MQLYRRHDELKSLKAEVLLISFSSAEQARRWWRETEVGFPVLLDPQRSAYRAYGLRSSVWRAWHPKVWMRYARMMLNGWKWRGIRDDPHQLGGDFVIDAQGLLRFAHRSADPTDRPDADVLLAALEQIELATDKEGIA